MREFDMFGQHLPEECEDPDCPICEDEDEDEELDYIGGFEEQ